MPLRDIFIALLVPCLWGFGFVIAKPAMQELSPILLNGLRWSLTGILMFWFFPFPKKLLKNIIIVSILGCTIQYSLTYSGLNLIDAASASFLVQSEVPFGIIVAYFMLGEKTPLKNIIICLATKRKQFTFLFHRMRIIFKFHILSLFYIEPPMKSSCSNGK